jgi:transglutaminase-like putative cysteine protease
LDLTGQRRYELHWQVDLGQGGPEQPPARLLMPRWGDPRQTFEFTVANASSFRPVSEGSRDFIDVVQKPGEPFAIRATVTIRGVALGPSVLERLTAAEVPEAVRGCLGPFQHGGELFDPASPLVSRIAGMCRSTTPARTVQNLLNWMRDNMKYADTQNRTADAILAGGLGVCHHCCSSFVALCRAAGIPARVAHGVVLEGEGEFKDNQGSHGWVSVYLVPLGWVPLDPLDANSLAFFGRSHYLLTDYANETAADNHFAYRSIQGFTCAGKVLAVEAQPR